MAEVEVDTDLTSQTKKESKDRSFFAEFVLATVLSILAGNLWHDLLQRVIPEDHLLLLFMVCILITGATIFLLEYLFSKKTKKKR